MNSHRGFDGLATPTGIALMSLAFLFFIVVCAVGGIFWRAAMRADRERRAEMRAKAQDTRSSSTP